MRDRWERKAKSLDACRFAGVARIEVSILAVMTYGIVGFVRSGLSLDHHLFTYAAVLGGVAASAGLLHTVFLYPWSAIGVGKLCERCSGFFLIFYSLYAMTILGVFTIF